MMHWKHWKSVGIKPVMLEFEECGNHTNDVGFVEIHHRKTGSRRNLMHDSEM